VVITLNNIWTPAQSGIQNLDCRSKRFRRRKLLQKKRYTTKKPCNIKTYMLPTQRLWPVTRQTCPPIREDATWHQYCVYLNYKIWSWVPQGLNAKTDWLAGWLTDSQWQSSSDSDKNGQWHRRRHEKLNSTFSDSNIVSIINTPKPYECYITLVPADLRVQVL
jgi:hypothetical protein